MSWSEKSFSGIRGHHVAGHDDVDADDNPAGGHAMDGHIDHSSNTMPGLLIRWQDGPVANRDTYGAQNGAFVERRAAVRSEAPRVLPGVEVRVRVERERRLRASSGARSPSCMERRTDRRERGVEGRHEV